MPYSVKGFFEINEDMVQILLMFGVLFQPIQDDFQHDFARMTDEADSSVVLAELLVALFRECNNQRLSPWGRPFSCSPDSVTDLC